ncbi:hypothetical protein JCM17845_15600 [Iodidimonas gelatinilytica]|uniref:Uncharacterized protein n=1 Tax=Iodidimonas gelatinilytica TaxID=1236966 RepID=A0A5A7MYI0_9PROT|nr:hypothetical protein [Iodidimonas gelatinilytica]GER00937.1 hypothetical protein JCM17845_15600 [Iodidimonas gelatinilytica]
MPASPDRAAFATRDMRLVTQQDPEIRTTHPDARDTGDRPRVSFFDDLAQAQAVNAERAVLLMALPQRLSVSVSSALIDLPGPDAAPCARLSDAELHLSEVDFIVSRMAVDLEAGTTALELFRGQA